MGPDCQSLSSRPARHKSSVGGRKRVIFGRRFIVSSLTTLLLCGTLAGCCQPNDPTCRNVSVGPSEGEVIGIAAGVGAGIAAVVAVEVHHARHTLKGCVSNSPGGQELQIRSGARTYVLAGNTANIQAGGRGRLSGTRLKQSKHSPSDPVFMVDRMSKDDGFCTSQGGSSATRP